ncbi:hypothetical protein D3C78_1631320 [compost metagenome]
MNISRFSHSSNLFILFHWKIRNNQSAYPFTLDQLEERLQPQLVYRIIIREQNKRNFHAGLTRLFSDLYAIGKRNIVLQCTSGCSLYNRSIGQRIRIWHTQLNHISSSLLDCFNNVDRRFYVRIAHR